MRETRTDDTLTGLLRSRGELLAILALTALPLALIAINDSWTRLGAYAGPDPWFYTGLFIHFPEHVREFEHTYYATRLAHVLPGAATYSLLHLPWSSYALRLTYWYLAVFSLYATLRTTSWIGAYITCVLFGTSVYFLWAIGWDYVDGAAVSFLVAAGFFSTRREAAWRSFTTAGALQLFAATTYILVVVLVPLQLAHAAVVRIRNGRSIRTVGWTALGWAAGYASLGLLNVTWGGSFNFIEPQIDAITTAVDTRELWKAPDYGWIGNATWLYVPLVATVCSMAIVGSALRRIGRSRVELLRREGFSEAVVLLTAVLAFAASEVLGYWLLQLSYYSVYLLPFSITVLGVVIARATVAANVRHQAVLALMVTAAALLPFAQGIASLYPHCAPSCDLWPDWTWPLGAIALLFGAAAVLPRPTLIAGAVLGIALVNVAMADTRIFAFPADQRRHAEYATVIEASTAVRRLFPHKPVRFWYDYGETHGVLYRSIASTYMWNWRLVGEEFPRLTRPYATTPSTIVPGDAVVVLTSRSVADVVAAFRQHGASPRLLSHMNLLSGGAPFQLLAFELPVSGDVTDVPLSLLRAQHGTVLSTSTLVTVTTAPQPYAYAATLDLRRFVKPSPATATLTFDVSEARRTVGVCVLNAARTRCVARTSIDGRGAGTTVFLGIPDTSEVSDLVVQSWADGESAELSLARIQVIQ